MGNIPNKCICNREIKLKVQQQYTINLINNYVLNNIKNAMAMVNVQLTQSTQNSTFNPQQLLLSNGDEQPVNTIVQSPQVSGTCNTHSCTASRTKAISHDHCQLDHSTNSHPHNGGFVQGCTPGHAAVIEPGH